MLDFPTLELIFYLMHEMRPINKKSYIIQDLEWLRRGKNIV